MTVFILSMLALFLGAATGGFLFDAAEAIRYRRAVRERIAGIKSSAAGNKERER